MWTVKLVCMGGIFSAVRKRRYRKMVYWFFLGGIVILAA